MPIERVGVIGAGTMGNGIAQVFARLPQFTQAQGKVREINVAHTTEGLFQGELLTLRTAAAASRRT